MERKRMGQTHSLVKLLPVAGWMEHKDLGKAGLTVVTLSLHEEALSPALHVQLHGPLPLLC